MNAKAGFRPEADTPPAGGVSHRQAMWGTKSPEGDTASRCLREFVSASGLGGLSFRVRWLTPPAADMSPSGLNT